MICELCYDSCVTAPRPVQEGGVLMYWITSYLVAVAAGIAVHCICKWLDGDR